RLFGAQVRHEPGCRGHTDTDERDTDDNADETPRGMAHDHGQPSRARWRAHPSRRAPASTSGARRDRSVQIGAMVAGESRMIRSVLLCATFAIGLGAAVGAEVPQAAGPVPLFD